MATLATGTGAFAAAVGDSNAGDVWVDTAGAPPGPGHEMDPHLPCANITLWGARMADPSGTYVIDGWPPSGSQEQDYSSTWAYDTATGGDQAISTINIATLIATAQANGDKPAAQGYHFKLTVSQDPVKHKTFWVDCTAPPAAPGTSPTAGGSSPTTTGTPPATMGTPTATSPSGSALGAQRVLGVHAKRHKKHRHHKRHHRHLVRPAARHHVKARHVRRRPLRTAVFTG